MLSRQWAEPGVSRAKRAKTFVHLFGAALSEIEMREHDVADVAPYEVERFDLAARGILRAQAWVGRAEVAPQLNGPLMLRGNLEIISGPGRMVARLQAAKLCRCGHSNTKPYCDNTHAKIGFRST